MAGQRGGANPERLNSPDRPGPSTRVNKGIALHIRSDRWKFTGRHLKWKGQTLEFQPQVIDASTPKYPFTALVSVTAINQPGFIRPVRDNRQLTIRDQIVANAVTERAEEVRLRPGISETTASAMEAVADVIKGDGTKIYKVDYNGVALNFDPTTIAKLAKAHSTATSVTYGERSVRRTLPAPAESAPEQTPDDGIAVEQVTASVERGEIANLVGYYSAMEQFRSSFGADPVTLTHALLADPYANLRGIKSVLEHAAIILAASAVNPGENTQKSLLATALDADARKGSQVVGTLAKVAPFAGEALGFVLDRYVPELKAGKTVREIGKHAGKLSVGEVPAEDDLLELLAVGVIKHALDIVSLATTEVSKIPGMDEKSFGKWKGEVTEVVRWALSEVENEGHPLEVTVTREGGMKPEAQEVRTAFDQLRRAVAPQN